MKITPFIAGLAALLLSGASASAGDAWSDPENPIRILFKGDRLDLWSLKPIAFPEPSMVQNSKWPRTPIDHFVLARLEEAGLDPAPEADRQALGRRLSFVLTGLPSTPEDLEAFVNDPSADAYEAFVDRLLNSPAFGEHWARLWMDLVRYSDSNGYDWDEFRPQMWRYRDYIVRSMNADKPLDQFLCEQLAGDEMLEGAPRNSQEQDALIATGYLRTGPWDNSSVLFNEEHKTQAAMMADLTETTASAFLGMTMTCCRCHDHKTEPLSQSDHYRFRAFFAGVKFADDTPLNTADEQETIRENNNKLDTQIASQRHIIERVLKAVAARLGGDSDEEKVNASLTDEERTQVHRAEQAIADLEEQKRNFTTGVIMVGGEAAPTFVLAQGDPDQPQEAVLPGIPSVFEPAPWPTESGRPRSALADWITAPENPLTSRVLANHVWNACFGQGIVSTPSDFGYSGSRPSHPALLDFLASSLQQEQWSLKQLIRSLVTSATWRQSAWQPDDAARKQGELQDPHNTLLWRMNPRRLTAEQLRDAMLSVAGLLSSREGGPPVWPTLPPEILQANPAFLDDNAEKTKGWYPSPPEEANVRSLYLVQKRSVRLPFMEAFDQPDNFTSCSRRTVSTVAPQAFTLLNNPIIAPVATALAERAVHETTGNDQEETLIHAWTVACGRPPMPEELASLESLLTETDLVTVCRAILNTNAFLYLD